MSETTKKPGAMIWLVIGGLVLINVAVLFSLDTSGVQLMQWIYTLNPRCWPVWYAWNFWVLVVGTGGYLLLKNHGKRKMSKIVLVGTWLIVGLISFICSFFCKMLRIQTYYILAWCLNIPYACFYKPFVSIPLTEFSATGTVSWRLFILPAIGICGILFLVRLGKKQKQKKTATKRGES